MTEPPEGLRERKKRETRQHISDVATGMFLQQGFDGVRVADIAGAAGVSEKTVYNYFDTKEALLLDREEVMAAQLRAALGSRTPHASPIEGMLRVLRSDIDNLYARWSEVGAERGFQELLRFTSLIESTPSLRAAQRDMMQRLVQVAAQAMSERAGVDPMSPESQIAADALVSLWRIQFMSMRRQAELAPTAAKARAAVIDDVERAARLVATGLWSYSLHVQGIHTKEQLKAAATAAGAAHREVMATLKQASHAWRDAVRDDARRTRRSRR